MLNQVYNNKYSTVEDVLNKLAMSFKNKEWDRNDVEEWCADCIIDEVGAAPEWFVYRDVKLNVNHTIHKALEPCNVHRLLNVVNESKDKINFYDDGTYIKVPDNYSYDNIYIDYYGLPVSEDGKLLILKQYMNACYYHCIIRNYEEDFMDGKIDMNRWNYFLEMRGIEIDKGNASVKNWSFHDTEEMIHIMYNMIPNALRFPKNIG